MGELDQAVDLTTEGYAPLRYPGPSFRPVPGFTLHIPPGWVVDEFPDALCVIATPESMDGPWSNVFIQHERVPRTTALEEVAVESWERTLADFPDAKAVEEHLVGFEQFQYIREAELTLLGERVTRLDSYWFGDDVEHPTADLFHFIGLHPVGAGDERTLVYLKMLGSFRFG